MVLEYAKGMWEYLQNRASEEGDLKNGYRTTLPLRDDTTDASEKSGVDVYSFRLPKRPADRRRWKALWRYVKPDAVRGKTTGEIHDAFERKHPDKCPHRDTLSKIVNAGMAGLLDD